MAAWQEHRPTTSGKWTSVCNVYYTALAGQRSYILITSPPIDWESTSSLRPYVDLTRPTSTHKRLLQSFVLLLLSVLQPLSSCSRKLRTRQGPCSQVYTLTNDDKGGNWQESNRRYEGSACYLVTGGHCRVRAESTVRRCHRSTTGRQHLADLQTVVESLSCCCCNNGSQRCWP